ncbi:MAG: alpha/beta hydrolase [Albidovulum sp.]
MTILLSSCASTRNFAAAPNLFRIPGLYPDAQIEVAKRTADATLYYVTDRQIEGHSVDGLIYNERRSPSMALGRVTASFGSGVTWEELRDVSSGTGNSGKIRLSLNTAQELVRFMPVPLPYSDQDGDVVKEYDAGADHRRHVAEFRREIGDALRGSRRKEVTVFVHGFQNSFEDAGETMANIWHYSGRVGVPIFYSWPGNNNGLFGYYRDQVSGDYTIYHLKEFLRTLAGVPELENINLIAHSLGTDIATDALRELILAERAAGRNPRTSLKISNLILAAPDIDFGVVTQRLIAERFGPAFGQMTVYINRNDGALALTRRLASGARFGALEPEKLEYYDRLALNLFRNVDFVDVEQVAGKTSHSYFRSNPDVLSDISLILQTGAKPGSEQRPLEHLSGNFWAMHVGYPYERRSEIIRDRDSDR